MRFSQAVILFASGGAAVPAHGIGTSGSGASVGGSVGTSACLGLFSGSCSGSSGSESFGSGSSSSNTHANSVASNDTAVVASPIIAAASHATAVASQAAFVVSKVTSVASIVPVAIVPVASKSVSKAPTLPSPVLGTVGSTTFTSAQGTTIINDITSLDSAVKKSITAFNGFVGGNGIAIQGAAVSSASDTLQATIEKLLSDVRTLAGKGHFSASDSGKISRLVAGSVTTDLVKLYNVVNTKKTLSASSGNQSNIHDSLAAMRDTLHEIYSNLTPLLQTSDYPALQAASDKIYGSAQIIIDAYAS